MSWRWTSCVRSTTTAWGHAPRMTPFIVPANESRRPKSVVSVTRGGRDLPVAIDDEVRDEDEGFPIVRGREASEILLGRLGIGVRSLESVLHALVLHHQAPHLVHLVDGRRPPPQHRLDPLALAGR